MLDFGKVADLASVAEQAARDGDRSRLGALLEEMEQAVNAIERRSENP